VIIFGDTKHGVEKLSKNLQRDGYKADSIHGGKRQNQRQKTLLMFRQSQIKVLVATDVAARGLDIKDVTTVINYTIPRTYDDYIHRIGRTGRANAKGCAYTFA
jgi:ATP-dependent RNA helicase RhlE